MPLINGIQVGDAEEVPYVPSQYDSALVRPREVDFNSFLTSISCLLLCAPAVAAGLAAFCAFIGAVALHEMGWHKHGSEDSERVYALAGAIAAETTVGIVVSAMALRRYSFFRQKAYQCTAALLGGASVLASPFLALFISLKLLQDHMQKEMSYRDLLEDGLAGGFMVGVSTIFALACCACCVFVFALSLTGDRRSKEYMPIAPTINP